jgi:hypothetical protein
VRLRPNRLRVRSSLKVSIFIVSFLFEQTGENLRPPLNFIFLFGLLFLVLETIVPLVFAGIVFARIFDLGDRFEVTPSLTNFDLHDENRIPPKPGEVNRYFKKTHCVSQWVVSTCNAQNPFLRQNLTVCFINLPS